MTDHIFHRTGFNAKLGTLDSAANRLPTDRPVIIVTASFEGPSVTALPTAVLKVHRSLLLFASTRRAGGQRRTLFRLDPELEGERV